MYGEIPRCDGLPLKRNGLCGNGEEDTDMARKRPVTTEELFNRINGILKEKGKLSDMQVLFNEIRVREK